jgi:hypothetical protein
LVRTALTPWMDGARILFGEGSSEIACVRMMP